MEADRAARRVFTVNRYPDRMTLRPMVSWPRAETRYRERSQFSAPWASTLDLLDREVRHLGGSRYPDSVLQIAIRESDFRVTDGMPRANAIPTHPGVILNIDANVGPLSYPCDKFDRWQDNLRAIALGLEALRKVGRYGITPGNEQYAGWKALPGPSSGAPVSFTADEAERFLRGLVKNEGNGKDLGTLPQVARRAMAQTHPDRGGDRALWDKVERARDVLAAAGAL